MLASTWKLTIQQIFKTSSNIFDESTFLDSADLEENLENLEIEIKNSTF